MLDNFKFETFVDAHSNIFEEYLSSVISKLRETNPEYRSIEEKINSGASGKALRYAAGSNLFPRLL